jgi:plasmid maintenance system antidote protein VapI
MSHDPNDTTFNPDWCVAPGETLRDWRVEHHLTCPQAAERAHMTASNWVKLERGELPITEHLAAKLAVVTDTTAQFWLNRETLYREGLERGLVRVGLEHHARGHSASAAIMPSIYETLGIECPHCHRGPAPELPRIVGASPEAQGALNALVDALKRRRVLLWTGNVLVELDANPEDAMAPLWRSQATMVLDEGDFNALRSLTESSSSSGT